MDAVSFARSTTTWALLIGGPVVLLLISLVKTNLDRETYKGIFHFWLGICTFVFGIGFGFQFIPQAFGLSLSDSWEYSIHSTIMAGFTIFYIFLMYRLFITLQEKPGWRWLGVVATTYGLGATMNALLTGGKYLPVVGWFL